MRMITGRKRAAASSTGVINWSACRMAIKALPHATARIVRLA